MKTIPYEYKNIPISGGGYVTGFCFHETKDALYARTDVGGIYCYEREKRKWKCLSYGVSHQNPEEAFPIAIALDYEDSNKLYMACGLFHREHGSFLVSQDGGKSYTSFSMPMRVHGNLPGRGTGYRLIVDRKNPSCLYYASQCQGLWRTQNQGKSFEKIERMPEEYLTFVGQSLDGKLIFVGAAGVTTSPGEGISGEALYVSADEGETFFPLPKPSYLGPKREKAEKELLGAVAQRYAIDEKYIYVTYASRYRAQFWPELAYSCDAGKIVDGHVVRYDLKEIEAFLTERKKGNSGTHKQQENQKLMKEITPFAKAESFRFISEESLGLSYGFGGIDCHRNTPGLLVCSTISRGKENSIYRSWDYGDTWEEIMQGISVGKLKSRASYMQPKYNGGKSIVHWMTDLKIQPSDPQKAWFNTGTGVFCTENLLEKEVCFQDWSDGLEETVHLKVYAPPTGRIQVIDVLGDLGGFVFRDITKECENTFQDEEGNRYITCMNADYCDENPDILLVTPRGNWTGETKGGLILSKDGGERFEHLPMPYGLTEKIDAALKIMEKPNQNSGFCALSADGKSLVWSIAQGIHLPVDMVVGSNDEGQNYYTVTVFDKEGKKVTNGGFKAYSDRVNPKVFYGFGEDSQIYVSTDGGRNFWEAEIQGSQEMEDFPGGIDFTLIDCGDKTEVRVESGAEGSIYLAAGRNGLWKLTLEKGKNITARRLGGNNAYFRLGLGLSAPGADYFTTPKALYVNGIVDGVYGFYRSLDQGENFERLNTPEQMYGSIQSIDGDKRVFGRFYVGTGGFGLLWGEEINE